MTQDGRMQSKKQEEALCERWCRHSGCGCRPKQPDCYWWVPVKEIKATLVRR